MKAMKFIDSAGMEIEISDKQLQLLKERFQQELVPFGLDKFLSYEPVRLLEAGNKRILAELKTMPLPIWYPEMLQALIAAGFSVHTFVRKSKIHAPCPMYWVQVAWEIGGIMNGN